jgi:alkanesulfonate monooxygenase SsuD/methylene tetrahydromethanopterin reductase-like flavin-dependent oxidoreductase (luciferase family)
MRFGLNTPLSGIFNDLSVLPDMAREAEASGWDGFFVWDHLSIAGVQRLADPWMALALIAQATDKIRVGPLVTPLYRRHPAKLAFETVTLDHLSNGRLIMGAGLGSDMFGEISAFGGPLDDKVRAQMLDEGLAVLIGLWTGEPFYFEGKHYHLKHAQVSPACMQVPRIPIWIAASWQRTAPMRRAARYEGMVAVRGDLGLLSPAQIKEMAVYAQGFRPSDTPFDIVHFGSTIELQPLEARELIASYAQAGVTWWIETLPIEARLDQARRRIRLGPPF